MITITSVVTPTKTGEIKVETVGINNGLPHLRTINVQEVVHKVMHVGAILGAGIPAT